MLLNTFINFQKSIEIRGWRRKLYIQMIKKRLTSNIFIKKQLIIKIQLNIRDKRKVVKLISNLNKVLNAKSQKIQETKKFEIYKK